MKTRLLFPLVALAATTLFAHQPVRAAEKPQLFGSQKYAYVPLCSWRGTFLAVVGLDEEANGFQVWDRAARRALWKSPDFLIAFSRDEKTVMVAHGTQAIDGLLYLEGVTFNLLDARTGHLLKTMRPLSPSTPGYDTDPLLEYGFSADGGEFLLATQEYLRIYSVRTGELKLTKKWVGLKPDTPLICAHFTYDKKQLVAFDGGIVIFDARTGAFVRRLPASKPSPTGAQESEPDTLDISPDNLLLIEEWEDENKSRIYRLGDGKLLWHTDDWPTFSTDGKLAYVPAKSGLDVLDAHTGHKIRHLAGPTEYGFEPSPDGNSLYEARDGKIYSWPTR